MSGEEADRGEVEYHGLMISVEIRERDGGGGDARNASHGRPSARRPRGAMPERGSQVRDRQGGDDFPLTFPRKREEGGPAFGAPMHPSG